ncbi:hypothetical protein J6590_064514 [Homalodisca vitripennis]|nr:hypothetical protein J6590_064514 [Homalodisca vitripennis]
MVYPATVPCNPDEEVSPSSERLNLIRADHMQTGSDQPFKLTGWFGRRCLRNVLDYASSEGHCFRLAVCVRQVHNHLNDSNPQASPTSALVE